MRNHYTHSYLTKPAHKVTVDLVGLGGTGSQVLNNLGRINAALMGLGHPGLHVRAWDPDQVTVANLGRQLFSHSDIGINKAVVLVSRQNRFFGNEWEARPSLYDGSELSNIIITCVDTAKARIEIGKQLKKGAYTPEPYDIPYYWLDLGNSQKTGQCILGTLKPSSAPKYDPQAKKALPTVIKQFPNLRKIKEEDQGPSCSLAEALDKQDLFINSILAQFGCNLIWKLLREGEISMRGCYVNLEQMTVNPIPIK